MLIATQIRQAAALPIKNHPAPTRLSENGYTTEEFRKFRKNIAAAARGVPTRLGGGNWGHVWLVLDKDGHTKCTDKRFTGEQKKVLRPDTVPKIEKDDTPAQVALKQAKLEEEKEVYETQEGAIDALRDRINANVDAPTISGTKRMGTPSYLPSSSSNTWNGAPRK